MQIQLVVLNRMKFSFLAFSPLFLLTVLQCQADSWTDPEWSAMLQKSDVIALIEYQSEGTYRAKAKPITIYKGKLKTDEIWVSGFSNRYGPYDDVTIGDKYLVFLFKHEMKKKNEEKWKERYQDEPEYFEALLAGNAYSVWSPTAGDLKVHGDSIQYNLLKTTTYHYGKPAQSLKEFEEFLKVVGSSQKKSFHKATLEKITTSPEDANAAQYLMMLQLTSFSNYHEVFETIAQTDKYGSCFALARLLRQVKGEDARNLLIDLLRHENSIVQGEVVRSLMKGHKKKIAPILLEHLSSKSSYGSSPTNVMDPVRNELHGGQIEIIKALGEMKYAPAVDGLLPLLKTKNEYHFKLLVGTIQNLGSDAYIPYLDLHLKNKTESLIYCICRIITDNNLKQCKPALMEFISTHNRNAFHSYEYAISWYSGLACFDDPVTRAFLKADFHHLIQNNDSIPSGNMRDWLVEYMSVFRRWEYKEARPLIYEALYSWYGLNADFASSPKLFSIKARIEDSLTILAQNALSEFDVKEVKCQAYLKNTATATGNFSANFDARVQIELHGKPDPFDTTNQTFRTFQEVRQSVANALDIPIEHISSLMGNYISDNDIRFDKSLDFSLMHELYDFAKNNPTQLELKFLQQLVENNFAVQEFDKRQLNEAIKSVEEKLKP